MVGLPSENKLISVKELIDNKAYNFMAFSDVVDTIEFVNMQN